MKVKANGINFNCELEGPDNAPVIIFSNSLITNLSMWDDQAAALKSEFRVLRYDQRGHGGTDAPSGKYTFATLTDDVVAIMDALSIKRAHFAGISMGGMTALFLAERYGDRFDRIFPCDCGPASTPQSAQQWKERIDLGAAKGMEALVDQTINRWFPPEFQSAQGAKVDKVRDMIRTTKYDGFAGCAWALSDYDTRPGLTGIKNPILCICGTKDQAYPGVQAINTAIPGSKLVNIEGAGHICNIEQPANFTKAIRDFIKG